ncbi:serine hydrolase domain-containing protein [Streptomyces adelaidensis]|uniref:serine hydrolase domain-containing protein n=1 Tax=Streptomyces adelaidensis TaxID=2796465 RepID=UPI001905F629|nr:serine hydrolase domain-containing protein [Streptomyces adelaidensis]
MDFERARWQARLDELARNHHVPGACLAVLVDGEVHELASGLLNSVSGVDMTTDSLFQIGSVSKLFTATLVMQLIDEGRLELDTPVRAVLPEFRLADRVATECVTVRHLLSHTSGIEGAFHPDTGSDADCLRRYVEACAGLGQCHPVGATVSYCHSGYIIAGHVVERITGKDWDAALRERLLDPLGLRDTVTLPGVPHQRRRAFGHMGDPGQPPRIDRWDLPRSLGPGGGIYTTAADLITFARMHLADGAGLLSPALTTAMREPQRKVPDGWTDEHRGLGWLLFGWGGRQVYGHAGIGLGQHTFLHVVQDQRIAIALLANGGDAVALHTDLHSELLGELAGLTVPRLDVPAHPPEVDVAPLVGTYRNILSVVRVAADDTGLWAMPVYSSALGVSPPRRIELLPVTSTVFAGYDPAHHYPRPWTFYTLPDGTRYALAGGSSIPRVA